MTRYLHTLSAILFYILGVSVFAAYVLWVNQIAAVPMATWLKTIDLPLLCVALIYGGTSVYRSMTPEKPSRGLGYFIGIPLLILFLLSVFLKFW